MGRRLEAAAESLQESILPMAWKPGETGETGETGKPGNRGETGETGSGNVTLVFTLLGTPPGVLPGDFGERKRFLAVVADSFSRTASFLWSRVVSSSVLCSSPSTNSAEPSGRPVRVLCRRESSSDSVSPSSRYFRQLAAIHCRPQRSQSQQVLRHSQYHHLDSLQQMAHVPIGS